MFASLAMFSATTTALTTSRFRGGMAEPISEFVAPSKRNMRSFGLAISPSAERDDRTLRSRLFRTFVTKTLR
ncbi:hypothetical protein BDR07DRAFT_1422868, partial [Suillus spraguei]